jgi:hypothetical protein
MYYSEDFLIRADAILRVRVRVHRLGVSHPFMCHSEIIEYYEVPLMKLMTNLRKQVPFLLSKSSLEFLR